MDSQFSPPNVPDHMMLTQQLADQVTGSQEIVESQAGMDEMEIFSEDGREDHERRRRGDTSEWDNPMSGQFTQAASQHQHQQQQSTQTQIEVIDDDDDDDDDDDVIFMDSVKIQPKAMFRKRQVKREKTHDSNRLSLRKLPPAFIDMSNQQHQQQQHQHRPSSSVFGDPGQRHPIPTFDDLEQSASQSLVFRPQHTSPSQDANTQNGPMMDEGFGGNGTIEDGGVPSNSGSPFGLHSIEQWMTQRILTIIVGPQRQPWKVHEQLVLDRSPYLRRYIEENMYGSDGNNEIALPDTDPKLFNLLLRWVYGTALAKEGGPRVFRYATPDGVENTVGDYIGLYLLGGKLEITGVKNAAIDALYSYYADKTTPPQPRVPDMHEVKVVFDNTPPHSQLRRLLIAHCAFWLFSRRRGDSGLPEEWEEVLQGDGVIGFSILQMVADWRWVMGGNVPPMRIETRQSFHEVLVPEERRIKMEGEE
ncbi:hypothetical protein QBC47DRAFT_447256 [Echria macrotheca]|uniref:BTB domain-containing protein n=1 Tax=Echria macrotheca TaxID=438768 RepID=A0AAJ0F8G2_9PEZI|nr:hypothetical protein QBC47DRAFT_447256 [Echria macrotheca]